MTIDSAINTIKEGTPDKESIKFLLELDNKADQERLFSEAYEIKVQNVGKKVYFRGIIEFSNICEKNCYYCGVRRGNRNVKRYQMTEDQALKAAMWSFENKFGSVVIQAGERTDRKYVDQIERIVRRIKEESQGKLGITLSLGEQAIETYKRWFDAGAHRYLLRIESSNEDLYKKLHPSDHSYTERVRCIEFLRQTGYQVGTGVMIGLPYQTTDHLADDIIFFRNMDIDMIGMGPFITHKDTPMKDSFEDFESVKERQFNLSLKMIAVARLLMKDINIASTTALQALKPTGRELGLLAGANVIMPNITDIEYRPYYQLYDDKPCINEGYGECNSCLQRRIEFIGETVGLNEWGDPVHFKKRNL